MDEFSEFLDLRPVLEDEIGVRTRVGWGKFWDVVDFYVVEMPGCYLAETAWCVAVVTAVLACSGSRVSITDFGKISASRF